MTARHALVFGATGFIGRNLILALDQAGVRVTAAVRGRESFTRLAAWLADRGCRTAPSELIVDFDADPLARCEDSVWADVTEVYNCAGAYRFGMTKHEARHGNVDSVRSVVAFAARLPQLTRLVYVSGYRVGGQDPSSVPWSAERVGRTHRRLGAYEASKVEGDAVFQAVADELGVPWSIVNPPTVIGPSSTGESDQYLGLAASLKELWQGTVAALPGDSRTFVPVIPVDYLTRLMTLLPTDPGTAGTSYWVLDDDTPALPTLLSQVGRHYRVPVPRLRIPVALVKRLPQWLTKADPETLTFLSSDRYPTDSAQELARRHGLDLPDTTRTILRWADHLAAHRFGTAPLDSAARTFDDYAGVRTFRIGEPDAPTVILPGLPVNADTWAPVAAAVGHARVLDLPGLGMSAGGRGDWQAWLEALLARTPGAHLVGHSIGAAAVVEAAAAHPDKVGSITLVAPFFLQPSAGISARATPLTRWYLPRLSPNALSDKLTGSPDHAAMLRSSVQDLRRASVSANVATLFAATTDERWRSELAAKLAQYPGSVHVITGSQYPLTPALESLSPRAEFSTVDGAAHHPQLTHPDALAKAIAGAERSRV
ncbi:alpha/beta fold hydrolase [Nocardia anaemiae]|uniref:alpha/beta fold hydrolase n=1 Tax=Nocardia anaemiae TaxID=263910 RepID=UPI0007A4C2DA|nr:alpha/beta fold hydrolase [Nocardia anaemiae]